MTFWGTLLALLWDRIVPLYRPNQLDRLFGHYADWLHERFNAGTQAHGFLAWSAAVLPPALIVGLIGAWLSDLAWLLALGWSALVLYRCMGYRQLVDLARNLADVFADPIRSEDKLVMLGLMPQPQADPDAQVRMVMERLFLLGVRRLFGVLFWFAIFGGAGAVVYALTHLFAERCRGEDDFHDAIDRIAMVLDWFPVRLSAFTFALVGNFEEAMLAWRADTGEEGYGKLHAAGLGALGISNARITPDYVSGIAGLFNRAALLWLFVLMLFWLGNS